LLDSYKTLTGLSMEEAIARMATILEPEAYSAVKGTGADLTDVNPAYLREVATDVFGPVGLGWTYDWLDEHLTVESENREAKGGRLYTAYVATIRRLELTIYVGAMTPEGVEIISLAPIPATGSSDNENLAWALRGAITSAIVGAFNFLCWQLPIHKGLVSHRNVRKISEEKGDNGPEPTPVRPLAPEALISALNRKSEQRAEKGLTTLKSNSRGLMVGTLEQIFAGPSATKDRYAFTFAVFGVESSKELENPQVLATLDWLNPVKDEGGAWSADGMAAKEAIGLIDSLVAMGALDEDKS